ncbi:MAG: acyl carrier protein [Bacteroidales bacterium]
MEKNFIQLFAQTLEMANWENLNADTEFRQLEQWDSVAYLSVIAMIDEEYGVVIEGKDFSQLKTLGDIENYIKNKK